MSPARALSATARAAPRPPVPNFSTALMTLSTKISRSSRTIGKFSPDENWMGRRLRLTREWHLLVSKFAPHNPESPSIWRYSDPLPKEYPHQGWKIHVSGTPLNASQILRSILPILIASKIVFKLPKSLDELMKINSGIFYGYSQIGKFVTVYPKDESEFKELAARLHEATKVFETPDVPFDFHYG